MKVFLVSFYLLCIYFPLFSYGADRIAIIGAGLSGLTAGYRLKENGYDVHVYEARARAGGRVFSVKVGDGIEELGGKNLNDGGDANHILALIKELGLEVEKVNGMASGGWFYDAATGKKYSVFHDILKTLPDFSKKEEKKLAEIAATSKSLGDVIQKYFEGMPLLRRLFELRIRNYEGSDPNLLSLSYVEGSFTYMLKSSDHPKKMSSDKHEIAFQSKSVRGGNGKLIEALVKKLGERLHLNMALQSVGTTPDKKFRLVFLNGQVEIADRILLSIPGGVLKKIQFDPGLIPDWQWKGMTELQYGTLAKILVPVRLHQPMGGGALSDRMYTWINHSENVMTYYYGGSYGLMKDKASLQKSLDTDLVAVRAVFPRMELPYGHEVAVPQDRQFSEYKSAVGISWGVEPYSLGGYSSYSVEQNPEMKKRVRVGGQDVISLFQPVENRIFFAGEHTSFDHSATMEGAVESGDLAAAMIKVLVRR